MPFFNRVCFPPWQSRFMDTQELILTINTAAVLSNRNIFFIKFSSTDEKITVSWVWISYKGSSGDTNGKQVLFIAGR